MDTLIINQSLSIQEALEILDESPIKTLFVTDDGGELRGSLTDGDIRRWILRTGDIKGSALEACNPKPFILRSPVDKAGALKAMREKRILAAPELGSHGEIIAVWKIEDLSGEAVVTSDALAAMPVVIMAGGKGSRLDPFTRILPKPLIPIGNHTVIELIMHQFARFGVSRFFISLNHKARLIKAYFEEQQYPYMITYLEEDEPLGTAGALKMLEGKIDGDLFVSNCDVIIKSDYHEILRFHQEGKFALTIVAAVHNQSIPYGVCELDEAGLLKKIVEKPQYSMLINTGMYVMNSSAFPHIPGGKLFHITHLIDKLQSEGLPIGVFPVAGSSYQDVGQWEDYRNALQQMVTGQD